MPSISLLVALLSLGPGDAVLTVVPPCARTNSFHLLLLPFLPPPPQAHRTINTIAHVPITNTSANPIVNVTIGPNGCNDGLGRSLLS